IEEDIPVLLLDAVALAESPPPDPVHALRVLLDYHLLYTIALFAVRAWDEGDPAANLERVGGLLADLGGPSGSGVRLVDRAETLLFVAVSTYEPDDMAYHRLLERVRALPEP